MNQMKIPLFITQEEKELFNDLSKQFAVRINKTLSEDKKTVEEYQENYNFWTSKVIIVPVDSFIVETSLNELKIFDSSYSFSGLGKVQIFNYLDEESLKEHYTHFSFYFKIEKVSISYSIRAKSFPSLVHYSWSEKRKGLKFGEKIDNFSSYVEELRKLNESKKIRS